MTIENATLAALLPRVATGDHVAFATLYDELSSMVFGIAKRVARDGTHAEAAKGNVRAWAATIAHRRAVDRVRSEQAHRNRERVDALAVVPATSGPEELAVDGESRQRAVSALGRLSPPQREALELAYYGGLTHVEVADQLGIALGTAKTRIRDGLLRLRSVLREEASS